MLRKFAKVIIAGTDLDPRIRYADERFLEIIILEPAGTKHGTGTGAACPINQSPAAWFGQGVVQGRIPSMVIIRFSPENCQF